mmetsp:Transcript_28581/g.33776  ORF Transcript_28581/g.33776 Transcript_28581/m.33776 type:complete len:567 (+) Transcript_28581:28-1728(+)
MATPSPTVFAPAEYSAGEVVQNLHKYPHYNGADTFSLDGEYWVAIETMFYLTCFVGFAVIVFQWFFFCFESCCRCCEKRMKCSSFVLRSLLGFLFLWLLAGTGLSYWGRNEFQLGASRVYDLCIKLSDTFKSLEEYAASINTRAAKEVALSGIVCSNATSLTSQMTDATTGLQTASQGVVDLLDGLGLTIEEVGTLFETTIPRFIDWGIGLVTAFIGLTVFFGFWTVLCGSARRRRLLIAFSACVLVILCPLIAFELTLSVVLSDFCVGLESGDGPIMVMANDYAPSSTLSLINYYGTCNGTNPISDFLGDAADEILVINSTAQSLKPVPLCSFQNLTSMQQESVSSSTEINAMTDLVGCSDINPFITDIFHKVVCSDIVDGVYKIWVVQLTCAVSLWVLLFLVMAEILTAETESRLELAMQEQRLDLKPSRFIPRKGTAKRRLYDKKGRKERMAEDKAIAEELQQIEQSRADDELAWAAADAEAIADSAADEKRQWLVKNPKGFGMGEERREELLRIGHGGAAAAAQAAAKKKQKEATKNKVTKKRNAKRTFDPDADISDAKKKA